VPTGAPHIILGGKKYELKAAIEIGRDHPYCDEKCRAGGFSSPPDIGLNDPGIYVSRHHVKVYPDRLNNVWIEDLGSTNGTAISRDGGRTFRLIPKFAKWPLQDGDVIAIVYRHGRGPYITFTFRNA